LSHATRCPQKRNNRKIGRSTQWITGIIVNTTTVSNNPLRKRKKGRSIDPVMQKSGAKFITLQDMI
jgi:hypothetical protein